MIRAGRVTVDGEPARIGQTADPTEARIAIDGVPLPVDPGIVHYLAFKPQGVISTREDTHGRQTVVGLVPPDPPVYPVGRLDADSEGLIVVTNDGSLTHHLTHPRFGVTKTYAALVSGRVSDSTLRRLREGVVLEDGPAHAVAASIIDRQEGRTLVEVVMDEGRNREVRRMFDAVGHAVQRLIRTAIGPLRDTSLEPGQWRPLDVREVRALYEAGSRPWQDGADADHGES